MSITESLNHFQALEGFGFALLTGFVSRFMTQLIRQVIQVDALEEHFHCLGPHLGNKFVGVVIFEQLVFARQFVQDIQIFVFGEEVHLGNTIFLLNTRLDYHIALIVNNLVELFGGQAEQITDFIGQRLEVPDMRYRHHQFDVPHALPAYFFLGYLNPTAIADNAFVADTLILTAVAFPVLYRPENTLAKQAAHLRLVGTVVDGFRLGYFTV